MHLDDAEFFFFFDIDTERIESAGCVSLFLKINHIQLWWYCFKHGVYLYELVFLKFRWFMPKKKIVDIMVWLWLQCAKNSMLLWVL